MIRDAIRKALRTSGDNPDRMATVAARLANPPRGVIPERGKLPAEDRVALFIEMAEAASSTVERIDAVGGIPEAVARYLREHNLPAALRTGQDPVLSALIWDGTQVEVTHGPARDGDEVSLSHATAAVAEAGTLVLVSGADNPTTLNFMPDVHMVVVRAEDVVGDYESAWDKIRLVSGKGQMPRTVNLIAGPSRSGDIQQTILLGAHGPRRLHILVVGKAMDS